MIGAVDQGHIGVVMLFYQSGPFDTIDHKTDVLRRRFAIAGGVLD